ACLDPAIAIAVDTGAWGTGDVDVGGAVVSGQASIAILGSEEGRLHAILLGDQIPHPRALYKLLPGEHTPNEQPNDDEHDRHLEQGEARTALVHPSPGPPLMRPRPRGCRSEGASQVTLVERFRCPRSKPQGASPAAVRA